MGYILNKLRELLSVKQQRAYAYAYNAAQTHQLNATLAATSPVFTTTPISTNTTIGTYTAQTNTLTVAPGTHVFSSLYNQPLNTSTLGNNTRDVVFLALKGVEEAAIQDSDAHKYDDLALEILDLRNFREFGKVSLLSLLSVCMANMHEPDSLITLVEGWGLELDVA